MVLGSRLVGQSRKNNWLANVKKRGKLEKDLRVHCSRDLEALMFGDNRVDTRGRATASIQVWGVCKVGRCWPG